MTSSGGRPLDAQTRQFFEPRLDRDLGDVRVHTGSMAAQSARAVDARAYAFGSDIVFGRGEYQPESDAGKRLIAHELAHVVQADSGGGQRDVIHRQPAGTGGDLAAIDYEIEMLSQIPIMGPEAGAVMMRLAQLEQQRAALLAQGVGAPAAPTVVCTDQDRALNVSKWRNTCLTVNQRWAAFKAHVDETWNREDDRGRRLAAVADWDDYVTQDEFDRLDTQRGFHNRYDQYLKFYAGGGQYERDRREREAAEKQSQPSPPTKSSSDNAFDFTKMRQIDIDLMEQQFQARFRFAQQPEPTPQVGEPETGCHTDPYARQFGGAGTVCGYQRSDGPTQATQKALQELMAASEEFAKQNRAMLDRLNAAYLSYLATGLFPQSQEFSPFEVEKDRIISVQERWDLANDPDPNNLEAAEFDERFFRSADEFAAELDRRYNEYLRTLKACGHSRPSHFVCRNKVMSTYFPGAFALYDASAHRAYHDMEVALPVLREGGPLAGFVFHATHEWLGWSTDRSASAANLASGVSNLAGAKIQQVFTNRNVARAAQASAYEPAPLTPPSSHVAPAPEREPLTQPGETTTFGPGRATDRLAGTVPRPVDVTNRSAFPPEPEVRTSAPSINDEIEQAEQRYDRLRQKAAQAEADYAKRLRPTIRAKQQRGEQPTEQETNLLETKDKLAKRRDAVKSNLDDLRAQRREQQSAASGSSPKDVGLDQEAVYVKELQTRGLSAQQLDRGSPVIDVAVVGAPEVHSVKSVVKDADAAVRLADRGSPGVLAKRVSSWITTALLDRGSDKWSRLRNQWNTTKRSTYADHYGYELPKNPDEIKFVVTVRVVSASAPSISAQQAVEAAVRSWLSENRWSIPPNFSWQIEYVGQ